MPQAVAAWASGVVLSWTGSVIAADVALVTAYAAANIAIAYGLSEVSAKLAAEQADDGGFVARDVVVSAGKVPQTIIYGETWVGGALLYCNSRHDDGSKDNFTVYRHIAHAAHEVAAITDLMFDDDVVLDSTDIDWAGGVISGGKYALNRGSTYAVEVAKTLGVGTESAPPLLSSAFPVDYPNDDYTTPGWATTTVAFRYFSKTAKTPEGIFYSGIPSRQLAKIKGHKCYDPRLDSTVAGGSGSHRTNNPATWAWTSNPILHAAHYMLVYMEINEALFDWATIATQATICSTDVVIPAPLSAEPRYHSNGAISLANSHLTNLQAILSSCLGWLSTPNGRWRLNAGAYQTPDVTITDNEIIGDPTLKGGFSLDERYNSVTGIYVNQTTGNAEEIDAIAVADASFVTRDGGIELPTTINLPFCSTETLAQRLAYKHLAQSDRQRMFTIGVSWVGLSVTIGTRVAVTFGKFSWNAKPFRCIGWKRGTDSPFVLTLREDDSAVWDDPTVGEYSVRDDQGVVIPGVVEIPSPTAGGANGELTVQNANFEAGDFYWDYEGTGWSIDDGGGHSGPWRASKTGGGFGRLRNYIKFPLSGATRVRWGGYVYTNGAFVGSVGWDVIWFDLDGSDISAYASSQITAANVDWTYVDGFAEAPSNAEFVSLSPTCTATAGACLFDDGFMMVQSGAKVGDDFVGTAGQILQGVDVQNDSLVVSALSAINANPSFEMPRTNPGGTKSPASWWKWNSAAYLRYDDDAAQDVIRLYAGDNLVAANAAMRVNPDTQYEVSVLARLTGSVAGTIQTRVVEFDSELLPSGKRCIMSHTGTNYEAECQDGTRDAIDPHHTLTNGYAIYSATYVPTSTAKWFSINLWCLGHASDVQVEWCVLRTMSTKNDGDLADLDEVDTGQITPNAVTNIANSTPSDYSASGLGSTFVEVATITVTTIAGQPVRIWWHGWVDQTGGGWTKYDLQLSRGSSVTSPDAQLKFVDDAAIDGTGKNLAVLVATETPGAGTFTYKAAVKFNTGGNAISVTNQTLLVDNVKR